MTVNVIEVRVKEFYNIVSTYTIKQQFFTILRGRGKKISINRQLIRPTSTFLSFCIVSSTSNQFFICCFHHLIWYLKLSLFGAYETLSVDDEAWYWILCKCLILLGWFFKQYNYTLNTLWNFIQCGNVHCNHSYPVISSLMTEFMKSSSKLSQRRTDWVLFCYSWRD